MSKDLHRLPASINIIDEYLHVRNDNVSPATSHF